MKAFYYATKVWLTGVVMAPILLVLLDLFGRSESEEVWFFLGAAILLGGLFSVISYFFLIILVIMVWDKDMSEIRKRVIIQIGVTIIAWITFKVAGFGLFVGGILPFIYIAVMSVGVWTYPMLPEMEEIDGGNSQNIE